MYYGIWFKIRSERHVNNKFGIRTDVGTFGLCSDNEFVEKKNDLSVKINSHYDY